MQRTHILSKTRLRAAAVIACMLAAVPALAMAPSDLAARISRNEPLLIIDVRSGPEYQEGHIPGAINIPMGLLPHKRIPSSDRVVVYGDGLGIVDDDAALELVRAKNGISADALEGGYAAWVATTRLSTGRAGISYEKLPGITYQQLVAANKRDVVLVDLRAPAVQKASAETHSESGRTMAAAIAPDLLEEFATTLGVPVMKPVRSMKMSESNEEMAKEARAAAASVAAQVGDDAESRKLLVLVADSDATANEAARQLRASGHYRFTILIGGTEIIRHEGRIGLSRIGLGGAAVPVEN